MLYVDLVSNDIEAISNAINVECTYISDYKLTREQLVGLNGTRKSVFTANGTES